VDSFYKYTGEGDDSTSSRDIFVLTTTSTFLSCSFYQSWTSRNATWWLAACPARSRCAPVRPLYNWKSGNKARWIGSWTLEWLVGRARDDFTPRTARRCHNSKQVGCFCAQSWFWI